jgi:LuxR family maltose regulon positive regulatory protein
MRSTNGGDSFTQVLTAIINDITVSSNPMVLILDNYHTITTPLIQSAMTFLIDHLPSQLRLMIASRVTPTPWLWTTLSGFLHSGVHV